MKDILRLLIAVLIMPASFLVVADESVNSNENNDVRVEEEEAEVQVDACYAGDVKGSWRSGAQ